MARLIGVLFCAVMMKLAHIAAINHYYVRPDNCFSAYCTCPNSTKCEALSYYFESQDNFFLSNTIFYFLPGNHTLNSSITAKNGSTLLVNGVNNFSFVGLGQMEQGTHATVMQSSSVIDCLAQLTNLIILNSSNIFISKITFKNCGRYLFFSLANHSDLFRYFDALTTERSSINNEAKLHLVLLNISVALFKCQNVTIHKLSIQKSYGFGFLTVNSFNILVKESSFTESNFHTAETGCQPLTGLYLDSANFAAYYFNPIHCPKEPATHYLKIISSNISFGLNLCFKSDDFYGSGLRIVMEQSGDVYGIEVLVDKSIFFGNNAFFGSSISIKINLAIIYHTITITNSTISKANVYSPQNVINASSAMGSGFYVFYQLYDFRYKSYCIWDVNYTLYHAYNPIVIKHNTFSYNVANVFVIIYSAFKDNQLQEVIIAYTSFFENDGMLLVINQGEAFLNVPMSFYIKKVKILNNVLGTESTSVLLLSTRNVTMNDVEIVDNNGIGVVLIRAVLILTGNVTFRNNCATNGGAMYLDSSYIVLLVPFNVFIINNHATDTGGGIYIDYTNTNLINSACFLQVVLTLDVIEYNKTMGKMPQLSFIFENNTADLTGSFLYGGYIDVCHVRQLSYFYEQVDDMEHPIVAIRGYNTFSNNSHAVSSDAGRVCFCEDNNQNCSLLTITRQCYLGDDVTFSLLTVGQTLGATTGTVRAVEIVGGKYVDSVVKIWKTPHCALFNFTIKNANDSVLLLSSIDSLSAPKYLAINITVKVNILECPAGFELSAAQRKCDCDEALKLIDKTTTCNIRNNTITRSNNVWYGYQINTSCLITQRNCPFDYCKTTAVTFTISQPDEQCAANRSGILCGQCLDGMSVVLGSNQCAKCSNTFLTLLIPFSLAGIILVGLLLVLDITVSLGKFNGLIFFCNVVKLNNFVFFPEGPIPLISQFISWMNLDLGIETCLFNGMNDYIKVWLQFAFPFYIWIIITAIVLLSRYTRFHRLIGRNAIQVLATLILLSFNKLVHTVSLCLSSISLTCKGSHAKQKHWYVDPNVEYFSKNMAPLLVTALCVVMFLIIPYILLLLFCQLVEKHFTKIKCLKQHWLKMKPFLDAYNGPYKDECQFWTGLLLVTRVGLLVVILFTTRPSTAIAAIITTIAILFSILVATKGVYKLWYHNVLECAYMVILVLMCGLVGNGHSQIGTIFGLSMVFLIFLLTVIHHLGVLLKKKVSCKKCSRNDESTDLTELVLQDDIVVDSEDIEIKPKGTTTLDTIEREPLIFYDD